jgi:hypothetical protein
MRFDVGKLDGRAVGNCILLVAAAAQQLRDGRPDLARADNDNLFH